MQQIKEFLNVIDFIVGTWWGITFIDILPIILSGGFTENLLSSASSFMNFLVVVAGLIYLILRIIHFARMSKLNIEYKRQEIIEKQNANFYRKFTGEFIEPFKEEK